MNKWLPSNIVVNGYKCHPIKKDGVFLGTAKVGRMEIEDFFKTHNGVLKIKFDEYTVKIDKNPLRGGSGWDQLKKISSLYSFWWMLKSIAENETKMTAEVGTKSYVTYAEAERYSRRTATAERISWNR